MSKIDTRFAVVVELLQKMDLKDILADGTIWIIVVHYTIIEMLGKQMITNHFRKHGIEGMDDWIERLACTELVDRLYKLKLIDCSTHGNMKCIVNIRSGIVHDFSKLLSFRLDDKRFREAARAMHELIPIYQKELELMQSNEMSA